MRVLLLGATGMIGQGVLRECVASRDVTELVAIVRTPMDWIPANVTEVPHINFFDWNGVDLSGFDACFFCLGVSSLRLKGAMYKRVTYDLTMAFAKALVEQSPQAVFVYVSGAGTNAQSKHMWAAVKGATENAVMAMPFRSVYCFRPGYVQPLYGVRSKVSWYNAFYLAASWTYPLLSRVVPKYVTSSPEVGCAMLQIARDGWPRQVLENSDINAAAEQWVRAAVLIQS